MADRAAEHPSSTTVAAIATAPGGPIGVIRVSGPAAAAIGAALLRPWPAEPESHRLYYGRVVAGEGQPLIDRVLFCLMRGPRSFTGEDVLEIHGHGGARQQKDLLDAVLAAGAAPAGPGEFSLRAFLNGRLDLTEAESIAALIGATSEAAARHARRQLDGALGRRLRALRGEVLALLGALQGAVDFPELEPEPDVLGGDASAAEASAHGGAIDARLDRELPALTDELRRLAESYRGAGRAATEGLEIALVGRPNAGKSSLFNSLCGHERALVDAEPGTTRDLLEANLEWQGYPVRLCDTAGLRDEAVGVERRGLRQQRARRAGADLTLVVVDGCVGLADEELAALRGSGQGPLLIAWNKSDALACLPPHATGVAPEDIVPVSALCGFGLDRLRARALALLVTPGVEEDLVVTSARQAAALNDAAAALVDAAGARRLGLDAVLEGLAACAQSLGQVTGEDIQPALLQQIFSRFCVGK